MKAVLIRHGKTAGNLLGRYIGKTDESLCPEGRAELLKRTYPKADGLYVSPLKRCRETGSLIYPELPQKTVEELRECDFGEFENKNYLELSDNTAYQAWVDSGGKLPFPGGESRDAFIKRCQRGFLKVVEEAFVKKEKEIALIAHGGTLMSILSGFAVPQKDFYEWQVKNGEGFFIEIPADFLCNGKLQVLKKIQGEHMVDLKKIL